MNTMALPSRRSEDLKVAGSPASKRSQGKKDDEVEQMRKTSMSIIQQQQKLTKQLKKTLVDESSEEDEVHGRNWNRESYMNDYKAIMGSKSVNIPPECQVDLDKQDVYEIGHNINKEVD